jgi:hypothetical protein
MRRWVVFLPLAAALAGCGGGSVGTIRVPPARSAFPQPPPGAVVLAREHGSDALAIAVLRGRVQATLVGPDGNGVRGARVQIGGVAAAACGAGCYRAPLAVRARELTVRVNGSATRFALPRLPAPSAARLVARAEAAWRGLRTLVDRQHLASSPTTAIDTLWLSKAPDRISYRIRDGADGIVIGSRRWDRVPGGDWQESSTDAQPAPRPPWLEVTDAHLLDADSETWHVSFFDLQLSAWFELWIDRQSLRTRELRMTATAHFMHDLFGPFNGPVTITPPR